MATPSDAGFLPIDRARQQLLEHVAAQRPIVLSAEPGAGKTTRVPRFLLESGLFDGPPARQIWVIQPRRLAARLAATWVARQLGERPGERVGFQVRFEDATGPATRVVFMTDGVFIRRITGKGGLDAVGAVVLDEFHERRVAMDLGLALVLLARQRRPELALVVMSATLEGSSLAQRLEGAALLEVQGRHFPVELEHAERRDERALEQRVAAAVSRALRQDDGDLLVFLPGMAEIRRCETACAAAARAAGALLLPLHGALPPESQELAVTPGATRKVVLATNVAETSVTIDGVTTVIDSGLVRAASFDPWTGLTGTQVQAISRAAATQRAGRAGRTRPGKALRLFTRNEFEQRPAFEVPEVQRADLAEVVLLVRAAGLEPRQLPWVESPPDTALAAAERLLVELDAVAADGGVSEVGHHLAHLGQHPRLGRLLVESWRRGVPRQGAAVAARLGEREARSAPPGATLDLLAPAETTRRGDGARLGEAAARLERLMATRLGRAPASPADAAARSDALAMAVLAAFPDRVAHAREAGGERRGNRELLLCSGRRVQVSAAVTDPWVVVVEAEERGQAGGRRTVAHLVSAIQPEWLLELFAARIDEGQALEWNERLARVDEVSRMTYGALPLAESQRPAPPSPAAAELLLKRARSRGIAATLGAGAGERFEALRRRLETLERLVPKGGASVAFDDEVEASLHEAAESCTSLAALADQLAARLESRLGERERQAGRDLPREIQLPGGRRLEVHYESDRPPWVESFLQDFFGMAEGPRLAGGRVSVTLHLLAPNRRAVQVTSDLAGFWRTHYPELRKSLSRRYPRHSWPEDPLHAAPPPPAPPRRRR